MAAAFILLFLGCVATMKEKTWLKQVWTSSPACSIPNLHTKHHSEFQEHTFFSIFRITSCAWDNLRHNQTWIICICWADITGGITWWFLLVCHPPAGCYVTSALTLEGMHLLEKAFQEPLWGLFWRRNYNSVCIPFEVKCWWKRKLQLKFRGEIPQWVSLSHGD